MRKNVIAGNWKMNKSLAEGEQFVKDIANELPQNEHVESIICAPFPMLQTLVETAKGSRLKIGAQNMHFEESGAYTGEVSPVMLQELGVTYVIIGHSERRQYFRETDETVQKKVHAAFKYGLKPIVCVGETLQQREANETKSHVESQVKKALHGLTNEQIAKTIIAYEPIWAIGTGKTASSEDANDVCTHIRVVIQQLTTEEIAEKVVIQYGGSVKPNNIAELLDQPAINGALVGGASLDGSSFLQLVEASANE